MLRCAPDVLPSGIGKVEIRHQVFCFSSIQSHFSLVQVWNQGAVSFRRATLGDSFDLIVESPPFLDDDQARRVIVASRAGKIAVALGAIGSLKRNHLSHEIASFLDSGFLPLLSKRSLKSMRRALLMAP